MNIEQVISGNNGNSATTTPSQVVNVTYEKSEIEPEREPIWLWVGGIILVLFILFWIISINNPIPYSAGTFPMPQGSNQIQTNVVKDNVYITNGQTKMVSIIDGETSQLKTILPFG